MFHREIYIKTLTCFSAIQIIYVAFCGAFICLISQAGATFDNHFMFLNVETEAESTFSQNSNVCLDFIVLFCPNIFSSIFKVHHHQTLVSKFESSMFK
jgi:hypothetical protein